MSTAQKGDKVKIHYHGTLEGGEVFDSSRSSEPFEFELGAGMVIPGFDQAVEGMAEGDTKTVTIEAANAYGQPHPELVGEISKEHLPEGLEPEVGMTLQVTDPNGQHHPVRVIEIKEEALVLDGNHPLAGKDLTFELELVSIG